MGLFGPVWPEWLKVVKKGSKKGHFGLFWAVLGPFGLFWAVLGPFWPVLACFGLFWAVLGRFGPFLTVFGGPKVAQNGLLEAQIPLYKGEVLERAQNKGVKMAKKWCFWTCSKRAILPLNHCQNHSKWTLWSAQKTPFFGSILASLRALLSQNPHNLPHFWSQVRSGPGVQKRGFWAVFDYFLTPSKRPFYSQTTAKITQN
jgi:phosphotransferase system  glucose/maltose/N-acetylglucosamine-specific IIC component